MVKLLPNENLSNSSYNITSIKGNFSKCRYTQQGMILVANEILSFSFYFPGILHFIHLYRLSAVTCFTTF